MSRRALYRLAVVALLLALGVALSVLRPHPGAESAVGFGAFLWRTRRLDLLAQLGLMLVGALGIRALLPGEDEGEDPGELPDE